MPITNDLSIEYRSPADLIPYARNARTHSPAQVQQLAASIAEFGFTNPVLLDDKGVIIAGHGRLAAAQKLEMASIPTITLSGLSDAQRRALVLADNKLAENAGWDSEMLAVELAQLTEDGFDLDLIGFSDDELDELVGAGAGSGGAAVGEDDVPEVPETPVSRAGDIWVLGQHRLLCGDSTDPSSYKMLLGSERADMVFTDPPYNVNYANSAKDKLMGKNRAIANDNLGAGFRDFLLAALTPMLANLDGACYIAMSSSELDTLQSAFREAGGHWSTFIIWAKDNFTIGRADYQRQYGPILYGWPEKAKRHWCGARDQGDVWSIARPRVNDLHPTMKPVELVERAITNSSKKKAVVLDPFGGSGTTIIAAEKTGRCARMIELDPKYVDVIVRRWQDFTGKQATDENGRTFDEVAAERAE